MTNLRDPQGGELADLLDWWGMLHQEPGVLSTKTGRLQMTYEAAYLDTKQMEPEERAWYLARLDEVHKVPEEGWAVEEDWWHEPTTAYPATEWDTVEAPRSDRLVDSLRRVDVEQHPRHSSTLYLTLSWQPPPPTRRVLRSLLTTKGSLRQRAQVVRDEVGLFLEGQARFTSLLHPFMEHLMPLNADQVCTYLHSSVSWDRHQVRCPEPATDLDWQLTSELWRPGQPPMLGEQFLQPLTIKTWQRTLGTYVSEALSTLPFPCRYHVRWVPKSASTADTFLTWAEKRWAGSYRGISKLIKSTAGVDEATEVEGRDDADGPIAAGQSIIDMRKAVRRGIDVVGGLAPTVLCWSETHEDLEERVKVVQELLFQQGLVVRVERAGASIEWLKTLPGHIKYGIRDVVLSTRHLTAIMPHTTPWAGPLRDHYLDDEPLMLCSADGGPFRVATHVGNLGHVMIAGPSQTGKSAFIGLAVRQSARYAGRRGCIFDRDNALKAVTLLSGGKHYALGSATCARLQPLGDLDTEDQRQRKTVWLEQVLTGEGLAPDPDERRELWRCIQMLADLPRHQRTLSMARRFLPLRLKVGLEPFCEGGEYAFCDGEHESFAWEQRLVCFEMGALLTKPRALKAVLSYVFDQLETHWFDGTPVYIWADEVKWLLDIGPFLGEMEVWLKARAKKNVSVWVSMQELYDIQRTTVWQAMLNNMPSRILLPNRQALGREVRQFYTDIGVSERGLHQLHMAQPFRDYLYTSPLGTRLFQCALSPVERLLCAASRLEELEVLDHLAAHYSSEELPAAWLRHWGYPEHAALLDPSPREEKEVCTGPYSPLASVLS